jgi:DNA repair photolyase
VKIITRNKSPDVPFDRSINAYKGCEHGCVYCFARPTHAYLDLSPGLDFETKIFYKTNVREHLIDELARPRYRCATIAMGTNTDPYQPVERRLEITREVLEVALECRHPVSIVTKSHMVLRDVDLLSELAQLRLVSVILSVTTLSNELKTKMEPRTASPAARLRTIGKLKDAGIPVGAMMAPVIPFVNDHELEAIVEASVSAGVSAMQYILLRLPLEVKDLFEAWLVEHYPLKAERVMSVIRDTRGGKAYDSTWGQRMRGKGAFAELIQARFNNALRKHGLQDSELPQLRTDLFQPPSRATPQLSLW